MPDLDCCPCCLHRRVDEGQAQSYQFEDGRWKGCTACGFTVSGPDAAMVRAAWAACCRSTALKELARA